MAPSIRGVLTKGTKIQKKSKLSQNAASNEAFEVTYNEDNEGSSFWNFGHHGVSCEKR